MTLDVANSRDALIDGYRPAATEVKVDSQLQGLVELVVQLFAVPAAAVNLLDDHSEYTVASVGVPVTICSRDIAMCTVAMDATSTLVIPDASNDLRLCRNPFVDGRIADVRFYAAHPLRNADGVVLGTLCVFGMEPRELDAHECKTLSLLGQQVMEVLELRRRSQQLAASVAELSKTRTELERSNMFLEAFAGQIGHDLRGPLAGIQGFLELAEDGVIEGDLPRIVADLSQAREASFRMGHMIDGLLDYARLGGTLPSDDIELDELVSDVHDDLANELRRSQALVAISTMPSVTGDRVQLRAVLQNLLANSVKFRRPGLAPSISISARTLSDVVEVRVADNGIGLAETDREKAFKMLTRMPSGLPSQPPGDGIGLATCRRIIEAHGGRIWLEDGIDCGLSAVFTLPVRTDR